MADLTESDVTVTLLPQNIERLGRKTVTYPTIAFGDNVKVCPASGIPMPLIGHFGIHKEILRAIPVPNGDGIDYVLNRSSHKLQMFSRVGGGVYTFVPGGGDIKGSVNTDQMLADQDNLPVNGNLIDTLHAVLAGPAWSYSEDLEPDVARNVCIVLKGATGGSVIPAGTYTFTITGIFRGATQTDTISFVFVTTQGTIAEAKHRFLYGVKPFEKITSVVITPAHLANLPVDLLIGVGIGSKLGLPQETLINVVADIIKITKNAADLDPAGTFSGADKTVNLGTLADGDDLAIQYKTAGGGIELAGYVVPPTTLELMVIGQ